MSELDKLCAGLDQADLDLLHKVIRGMGITADLSRSDLLLLCPRNARQFAVVAQAQPHSISSLYTNSLLGKVFTSDEYPVFGDAWQWHRHVQIHRELLPSGAPVIQDVYPILGVAGRPIALFSVEISQIQLERHRTRHKSFQHAIEWLKAECMHGELANTDQLSPFAEWDGVLMVDTQRRITYLSGIANNLYRRLGYLEDLRNRRLSNLNTDDDAMVLEALKTGEPAEAEAQEGSRIWIRKVLPVYGPPLLTRSFRRLLTPAKGRREMRGILIMVRDATDDRRKKQELRVKSTMIQEVHHRVKNNLQTVAAMLRMQARRTKDPEALQAVNDAVSRILSVAVIHEFLSREEGQTINIRDVCQRIINQTGQVAVTPGMQISFSLEGPNIYLPSQQATACALVVNELIQNALEHGFEQRKQGQVHLQLADCADAVRLEITDDGDRLPDDFDIKTGNSLGLQIVQTLVQDDLHGELTLANHQQHGVVATVQFPKQPLAQE